jgi:hypothetical protein
VFPSLRARAAKEKEKAKEVEPSSPVESEPAKAAAGAAPAGSTDPVPVESGPPGTEPSVGTDPATPPPGLDVDAAAPVKKKPGVRKQLQQPKKSNELLDPF